MTEKQVTPQGLTNIGWKKVEEILTKANKAQIKTIMMMCFEKIDDGSIEIVMRGKQ